MGKVGIWIGVIKDKTRPGALQLVCAEMHMHSLSSSVVVRGAIFVPLGPPSKKCIWRWNALIDQKNAVIVCRLSDSEKVNAKKDLGRRRRAIHFAIRNSNFVPITWVMKKKKKRRGYSYVNSVDSAFGCCKNKPSKQIGRNVIGSYFGHFTPWMLRSPW